MNTRNEPPIDAECVGSRDQEGSLELAGRDLSNREIAERLGLKPKTVRNIKWRLSRMDLLRELGEGVTLEDLLEVM